MQHSVTGVPKYDKLLPVSGNPGSYFGKQLQKERLSRGWSLDDLARETGISAAHWSRIENGKRPATAQVAVACDKAFPSRRGWFREYYFELQTWTETPPWFKPWSDVEMRTTTIRAWSPGVMPGLLQAEDYVTALVSAAPGATADKVAERVANRMARQKRVLFRDDPPQAHFLVDITSLRRMPAALMSTQLRHLLTVSELPSVTMQVVPECWHPGLPGGFVVADGAAYTESMLTGQVYADEETVSGLSRRFASIAYEAMRVSESLALIREMLARERLAKVNILKRQRRGMR
jgi:plasmid maintenance system antidote protein VapI